MEENMSRPTGLKQPTTKIPALSSSTQGGGLHEITDSQHNARAQFSAAGFTGGLKRNAPTSGPDPKRKPPASSMYQSSKIAGTTIHNTKASKGVSLLDLNRAPSANKIGFSQLSNNSYSSNSKYGSSIGSGRPPSRSHARSQSATRPIRPATSMGTRDDGRSSNVNEVNDIDEKVAKMGSEVERLRDFMESTEKMSTTVKEELESSKKRVISLEDEKLELQAERGRLKDQLQDAERQARSLRYDVEELQRQHERRQKILEEDHRRELELITEEFKREMDKNEKLQREFESKCGAEAEARLENLSQDNKELRSTLERQKRDHEHEIRLLHEAIQRRDADVRRLEDELRKANNERFELQTLIRGNNETIERLRKRAEDAEERLSKDKGHLGGQISLLSSTLDLKSERIQTLEENAKKLQAECEAEIDNIKSAAENRIAEETASLRERLIKEEERRHKLFEQVQELKGNIRVMCRIKPPSDPAKDALIPFEPQWNDIDEDKIDGLTIPTFREDPTNPGKMVPAKPRDFNFERVFDEKCNNGDVFDEISQLVQSVMDGKKVCIFCYGQTGSGKTFTMSKRQGDGDDGVIPRTQGMIFSEMERLKTLGWEYTVEGSYLEVYQDKLYDLLASRHSKPEPLTVDPIGDELKIKGHDFTLLNDARDLDEMIRVADNNRHTAATVKNDRSSRSHSILVLKINGIKRDESGEVIKTRKGTLNLIDLAGSEKPDKNGPEQVYKEGVEINSSLSYLRTVLSSLGQGKTEGVDFRSYTLTQLLRPSLGKGCRTLMFVMVSPLKENENETIRSLEFARDAQKVKMGGNGAAKSRK
ncbi:P-loop containing nucleoside triphosphate hydrolase protein [Xylaria sp. FL0933]|nr:P-loop containing nucleoside triphosphate hydrolase protein [Xylaria sp. FL0933]